MTVALLGTTACSVDISFDADSQKADTDAWNQMMLLASTVNAAYTPYNNSINIQAGILNGEIYNENMSYEQKLGGISPRLKA